ncbi:tetR-family transcriptional regulator [Acinetobacter baumannii 25493_8]|jgi:transcriptional regulator, TetR family|uniref:TetR family transcriptional regulator n=7 Tax=Acinetobacter baumannii TaxID=470 RepID=A0A0D8GAB8_ACIBA|nr:TetR/AcrR family transcriptional regulator [Acinetobacter baumannii]ABO13102.2 transcriptional regulator TetR family [Acinetobacter baumannii ATCC 17978]AGQ07711.1 Transcriptional regulator [Acinetobacter baumannii BJAB0715]ANS20629.1 TetR family transcriptional regulator [Acinetobacter baumannii PR07]EJP40616.1 transcriptional regulator, TetR family [Acinetobacter baumannii OIFC032]EKL61253.1 transcriptional regulator, TetR family [Acinetobacter baumannii OIFC110]EKP37519.1 transcriptiona
MSVREQKMAETRKKLIEVARRAFAEYGYADTSMDKLTAEAGLTRGALYHHFGDKRGLFAAVVDQIDSQMAEYAQQHREQPDDLWEGLLLEGQTYIQNALNPEFQRIVLRDGPAVLGDPAHWPSQNRCLQSTRECVEQLLAAERIKIVDPEAAAVLLNGAAMNAALWVASSEYPEQVLPEALNAFQIFASGFLKDA